MDSNNKINSLSLAGFITSIISLFLNFWGIVGIVGVVLSSVGLAQINSKKERGSGLAISGIMIGVFSILYAFYIIVSLTMWGIIMNMNEKDWLIITLTIVVLGILLVALVHMKNQYNNITLKNNSIYDTIDFFND